MHATCTWCDGSNLGCTVCIAQGSAAGKVGLGVLRSADDNRMNASGGGAHRAHGRVGLLPGCQLLQFFIVLFQLREFALDANGPVQIGICGPTAT